MKGGGDYQQRALAGGLWGLFGPLLMLDQAEHDGLFGRFLAVAN